MTRTLINNGKPSMGENYQIARLMIALREAGLELHKTENTPTNAGVTPFLALVRALSLGSESETIISIKRMAWAMAKAQGGSITIPIGVFEDFSPDARLTQRINPFDKSVIIEAVEPPAAVSA